MSQVVCWFSHSWGENARGIARPPLAPRLRGRLKRFACLPAQHPPLSEQIWRMSRAKRWLPHPKGQMARMSRAVCLFGGP
eukprot:9473830-Pyramimonas_sp.AAC.1